MTAKGIENCPKPGTNPISIPCHQTMDASFPKNISHSLMLYVHVIEPIMALIIIIAVHPTSLLI
jgi:hypothetical protein